MKTRRPLPQPTRPILPPARAQVRANWVDERQDERGDMRVLQGFATMRAERVYDEATRCEACEQARAADGEDALCEVHLAQALGMHATWDAPR